MNTSLPGIYMILNTMTCARYVGSAAKKISTRFNRHRYTLKTNTHGNKHLQRAWNKYGEGAFQFIVIENTSSDGALAAEQQWCKKFKEAGLPLYNLRIDTRTNLGIRFSEESKKKMRGRVKTALEIERMSHAKKGVKRSADAIAKISHDWPTLVAPDGTTHTIHNLLAFCRNVGLDMSAMAKVARGERRIYKGWRLLRKGVPPTPYTDKLRFVGRAYTVYDPGGTRHETNNIEAFAREHGLHPQGLRNACQGKSRHHKGWTGTSAGYTPKTTDNRIPPRARNFISPDGMVHTAAAGLGTFCKQHGLDKGAMLRIDSGKQKVHLGWRKAL